MNAQPLPVDPFTNGPILFISDRDGPYGIYLMNPDGSDPARISAPNHVELQPAWSPDGTRIAFVRQGSGFERDLLVMNADGTGVVNVTNTPTVIEESPGWSPDGSRIVFQARSMTDGTERIAIMNADGTGVSPVLDWTDSELLRKPTWSPDASRIAFVGIDPGPVTGTIYLINPDGTGRTNLTSTAGGFSTDPAWSPDGSRIVFASIDNVTSPENRIQVMNADGSGRVALTTGSGIHDANPVWSADGSRIAFERGDASSSDVLVMDADGTNLTYLTPPTSAEGDPSWTARRPTVQADCSDGRWIAFGFKNRGQCVKYVTRW